MFFIWYAKKGWFYLRAESVLHLSRLQTQQHSLNYKNTNIFPLDIANIKKSYKICIVVLGQQTY